MLPDEDTGQPWNYNVQSTGLRNVFIIVDNCWTTVSIFFSRSPGDRPVFDFPTSSPESLAAIGCWSIRFHVLQWRQEHGGFQVGQVEHEVHCGAAQIALQGLQGRVV